METMKNVRVTIFEDNRSLREGLYQLVNGSNGFTCAGAFANSLNIVEDIEKTTPEVIPRSATAMKPQAPRRSRSRQSVCFWKLAPT
jgi:hypothetical protein